MSTTPDSDLIYLKVVGTTGITYKFEFDNIENVTVSQLKDKVSEKMYIPKNVFELTLGGKILDENKTLIFYEINSGSILNCIERTLGGNI